MLKNIHQHFSASINDKTELLNYVTKNVILASKLISDALIQNKKLLLCGNGLSEILSTYFIHIMKYQYQINRPSFPVISLNDPHLILSLHAQNNIEKIFKQQIQSIGQQNDILIIFHNKEEIIDNINYAIEQAHKQKIKIIAFISQESTIKSKLTDNDIYIEFNSENKYIQNENLLLILHTIAELIEKEIFLI